MNEIKDAGPIKRRIPIINTESSLSMERVDEQWRLITEAVKRDLVSNHDVRETLIGFCSTPLTETVPNELIESLQSSDERIARLHNRFKKTLGTFLALPPVPEDQITPDIRNAASLEIPEEVTEKLKRTYGENEAEFSAALQSYVHSGKFEKGLTSEERLLVAKRYSYARDVKLLALGAEILEHKDNIVPNRDGEIILPSGIRMVIDLTQGHTRTDLLNPHFWERRRQLKDRVYEIQVRNRRYILKEKKTPRHTDTIEGGHIEGRLSAEEFLIARQFQEEATVERGNLKASWEKPIGFVTYPDGFQFAVFEFEEGLIAENDVIFKLAQEVSDHRAEFEQEYQHVANLAEKYRDSPRIFRSERTSQKEYPEATTHVDSVPNVVPLKLSFDEYAIAKAMHLVRRALWLREEALSKMGYTNDDFDGYSYRVYSHKNQLGLEVVGYDFEYFEEIAPEEAARNFAIYMNIEKRYEAKEGISFLNWADGSPVTRIQKAAYFAILEIEGLL